MLATMLCADVPTHLTSYTCGQTLVFLVCSCAPTLSTTSNCFVCSVVMGGEQAASVLSTVQRDNMERKGKSWSEEEEAAFKAPIAAKYENEGQPFFASARLWDDGVILPQDTRKVTNTSHVVTRPHIHTYTFILFHSYMRYTHILTIYLHT